MTVREYKDLRHFTNRQLTADLRQVAPGLDEPIVSRMVSGLVGPSEEVAEYIDSVVERVFAIGSDMLFGASGASYRPDNLSVVESEIFDRLAKGTKYYPVTKHELCMMTGMSDRQVRRTIENIRKKGGRVCTSSRHFGYWIARNASDYAMVRADYLARIKSLSETVRAMDSVLAGQITWEEQRG